MGKKLIQSWEEGCKNAKTVKEKERFNVWDNFFRDVVPIVEKAIKGRWWWSRNRHKCKYITVQIDMRDGGCIIINSEGNRINPEDLAQQRERI
jgi:hypothetical protein